MTTGAVAALKLGAGATPTLETGMGLRQSVGARHAR